METGFKCLLSVLQLGAEPGERERRWQHLIQGADVRGSTLIRETLALGFSKEPQRLSAMCWNENTKVRREIQGSWEGWGKLFAGSSCHRDQALCSICVLSGLLMLWAPVVPVWA